MEDDTGDIGLANLSKQTDYIGNNRTRLKASRRPATLTIPSHLRRLSGSLMSPSLPDLPERDPLSTSPGPSPKSPRALKRSRTLPRTHTSSVVESPALQAAAPLEPEVLLRMRRWILPHPTVNFDLDIGPVIEGTYPSFPLSSAVKENLAFSSFPDSTLFTEGSHTHSFRIREIPSEEPTRGRKPKFHSKDGFFYGFVHFVRRKNSAFKRGYDQRSIVILTVHPWPGLFSELVKRLGPIYIEHGGPILEAACHNLANWPDPVSGVSLEMGFLGSIVSLNLTGTADRQRLGESPLSEKYSDLFQIAASALHSTNPLSLFAACLTHMWTIWECLILCEPLLIFGSSPSMTSQAVWWLLDIMRPIPFAGDYRPYFTIHDKDHSLLVNKNAPKTGLILGVTNPIFERTCKHWPHLLSLGKQESQSRGATILAGPAPGWQTKTHNRYISKDRELLKKLEGYVSQGDLLDTNVKASQLLHQHFSARTTAFLAPLGRYLNTLIPAPAESNAARQSLSTTTTLRLRPFNQGQFFTSLKANGSPLPFRSSSRRHEFYERWLRSPAFALWLARQEEVVNAVLRKHVEQA